MKYYTVVWKSRSDGRIGHEKTDMSFEEAQILATELNKTHPQYQHVAVPLDADLHQLASLFRGSISYPEKQGPVAEYKSEENLVEEEEVSLCK